MKKIEIIKNNLLNQTILIISLLFLISITLSIANAAETNITPTDNLGQTIENANNGDTINLDTGTYINNVTKITINKNLTIAGKNKENTTIDAQKLGRIFTITSGNTLTIINITITNGYTTGDGGAIYNNGKITINDCKFTNNIAAGTTSFGGAIYNNGEITVNNSIFTNNVGSRAGAIHNTGTLNINNSTFTNHRVSYYGSVIVNNGVMNINNSMFANNLAATGGGAIQNNGYTTNISNSIFKNNSVTSGNGGVLYITGNNMTITNSTFTNNNASGNGGVLYITGNNMTITNSTFTNNTGKSSIYIRQNNTFIQGCNIYNNMQGIVIYSTAENTIINYNRIFNNTNTTDFNLDNDGVNTNADLNWWGDNNPLVNGITLENYYIMNITNFTSLYSNGTVTFNYIFGLNTGEIADNNLLPYFVTDVYTNLTDGILESLDARFHRTFDITVNKTGNILYIFKTDNEIKDLAGTITIPPEPPEPPKPPEPPEPPKPPEPPEPPKPPEPPEPENNKTTNNLSAGSAMKETGMPINFILIIILSVLGILIGRKQN